MGRRARPAQGRRPALEFKGHTGAGADETTSALVRIGRAEFGPVRHDDRVATVDTPPAPGRLAGLLGNRVLARCAAAVFDVERRTLWLEPPCDRPGLEANAGWRPAQSGDAAHRDRPWVLKAVFPGGAAARAGLEPGDRLLSVEGTPAGLDVAKLEALVTRPPGTKLRITYARGDATKQATLELRPLLAPGDAPAKAP